MNSPLRDAYRHPALGRPRPAAAGGACLPRHPQADPWSGVAPAPYVTKQWARRPLAPAAPPRMTGLVEHAGCEGRFSWTGVLLFCCLGFSLFLLYLV